MALNLVQAGASAGIGVISGVLEGQTGVTLGTTVIPASGLAEAAAVVGGVALQFFAPYTMPDMVDGLVDGLVDGGIALLGRRVVQMVQHPTGSPMFAPMATRVGALAGGIRGLNASGVSSNKYQFV